MSHAFFADTSKLISACREFLEAILNTRLRKVNRVMDKYITEENSHIFRKDKFKADKDTNRLKARTEIENLKDKNERAMEFYTMWQNCLIDNSGEFLRIQTLLYMLQTADKVYISVEDMCRIKDYIK